MLRKCIRAGGSAGAQKKHLVFLDAAALRGIKPVNLGPASGKCPGLLCLLQAGTCQGQQALTQPRLAAHASGQNTFEFRHPAP